MLQIKKQILDEMDANAILTKMQLFLSDLSLNFPFSAYYTKKDSSFGNLNYSVENLTDEEKKRLELYKILEKKKGLSTVTFLTKKELIYLFNDILIMNGLNNYDVNKILLEEDDIIKDKNSFQEEEKIVSVKELDIEKEKDFNLYLLKRGIDPKKHPKIVSLFKTIITKKTYENEANTYIGINGFYKNSFDGYKLPTLEKAKIGFNSPTFISNDGRELYISEGKFDTFHFFKKNNYVDYLINNGINYSKFLFEVLDKKRYEKINFVVDKDIPGIIFYLETLQKLTRSESIQNEIEKGFVLLNKKLLTILKDFSETAVFQEKLKILNDFKNSNPLKRKKDSEGKRLLSLTEGNTYFEKYDSSKGFDILIEENNQLLDTHHLMMVLTDMVQTHKYSFLHKDILEPELKKITDMFEGKIDFLLSEKTKDFNDETQLKIKILDKCIQEKSEKGILLLNSGAECIYSSTLKLSDLNYDIINTLRNNSLKFYEKMNEFLDTIEIDYSINHSIGFEIDKEKINSIELDSYSSKELEETDLNNYMVYGIDEAGMGTAIGSLHMTLVYADKERIENHLLHDIHSNLMYQNAVNELGDFEKNIIKNLENYLLEKNVPDFIKEFETMKKNRIFKDSENSWILKPLENLYLFYKINDSKQLDNELILKISELMEELEKLSLLKKEYKDIKVDYHYDIKKVQKEGFIALSEIPQKVNDELKTKLISSKDKIEKLQEEKGILSLKNRYILEFIDDSLSKNKMVVIDGDDLLKELKREDIKIHFEPKADSKYFQVSLASIFSKAKQLEGIEKNVLELTSYVSKIKNTKLKSTLENLIHEIKNSKGYLTPKHIKTLEKVSDIETIPENIVSYLENIYRKNEKTTPLFKKISKNLKNISDNEIIL